MPPSRRPIWRRTRTRIRCSRRAETSRVYANQRILMTRLAMPLRADQPHTRDIVLGVTEARARQAFVLRIRHDDSLASVLVELRRDGIRPHAEREDLRRDARNGGDLDVAFPRFA